MGLLRRPTTSKIMEDGRFSRPCGPGALSRAIRENQVAATPPFHISTRRLPSRCVHVDRRFGGGAYEVESTPPSGQGGQPRSRRGGAFAVRPCGRGDVARSYRIYISSTYGDLKEHREKVDRALRRLDHDVVAMENYVAADQRPLAKCLEDVAACDLYVGIFAHRYGYIPQEEGNPEGRSITELEYRHAQAKGKPCLVFLLDPAAPWP